MPALDKKIQRKEKKKRKLFYLGIVIAMICMAPLVAELIDGILRGLFSGTTFEFNLSYQSCLRDLINSKNKQHILILAYVLFGCFIVATFYRLNPAFKEADTVEIAHGIRIPVTVGNGEYGTAHFMNEREMESTFEKVICTGPNLEQVKGLKAETGVIVNYKLSGRREEIMFLSEPVNVEILGATRSGKTRRVLLTSIWLGILAGTNQLIVDVKGEIYAYTAPLAKKMNYDVRVLDFRYPERSQHFNNMIETVNLLREGKISEAVDKAWDIVSILVGEPKGERIWTDGQCATIAAAILIVANDAPEECRNLTNVYYFLAYMCETDPETGMMPINFYLESLPENHPARGAFQIAKIAPFRTRSSFFTSALATLRLYTAWNVADVTGKSDYSFDDTDEKKVIYYMILPDEKTTYHPIGAIYMKQLYENLVSQAIKKGGELDRRFIFRADEIGNFPVIPGLGTMLSAGAGRNIFFELILQDYQQMESKYKDEFRNIRTNCQLTICLKATDEQTTKNLSGRLGTYTIQVNAASSSIGDGKGISANANYSANANMTGRQLLFPDEIAAIEKPDALILYGGKKAIVNLPDISEYFANQAFGMGDKNFNKKLFLDRMEERPIHEICEPKMWGIWKNYVYGTNNGKDEKNEKEKKVSFL